MKKIVLTGGGTAGHVTPNLALIPYLTDADYEIYYIGSKGGMEEELIKNAGITYYGVSSGKLRRYFDKQNFSDIFKVIKGILQAKRLIGKIKPDVVFSKGGFVAVPVVVGAAMNKVRVICHESDITPGLANKLAMPFASAVCTTFPEAVNKIKDNKGIYTGTPIRDMLFTGDKKKGLEICGFSGNKPVILIMGGSQGSVKVNNSIRELLSKLLNKYDIVHLCGKGNLDESLNDKAGYKQFEYISEELPHIFAMADMVVSRAGSNAICEFLALHKPMLLIPLGKNASRGDQILNAESFKKQGFAEVIDEEKMTKGSLYDTINRVFEEKDKYVQNMKKSPASQGIKAVMEIINAAAK